MPGTKKLWEEYLFPLEKLFFLPLVEKTPSFFQQETKHTAGSDTIFVQIYMDPPPGVPGVSKNQNFFFTNKTAEFLR